jgi:hypothetical protein
MKKLISLFLLACTFVVAQAQVPNADFENLNYGGSLQNWGNVYIFSVSIDSLGISHGDSVVFDGDYFYAPTADAHSGSTAMLLSNAYNVNNNQLIAGSASVDEDSIFTAWGSLEFIPIQSRPESLRFYYKFSPVHNDSAIARLALYDSLGEVIGEVNYLIIGAQNTYTLADVPIVYTSANPVMMYSLNFSTFYSQVSDYGHQCGFGTRLWIDDVELSQKTGIQDFNKKPILSLFPNPVKNVFTLDTKENLNALVLIDVNGKEVPISLENGKTVNCGNIAKGVYSVKIETDKGVFMEKLVIE